MNKFLSVPIFCAATVLLAACGGGSSGGGSANVAPTAVDDSASTTTATAVEINVVTNDTDSDGTIDATSVAIIGAGPADGTATINATTGAITYTSNANFVGTDTFDYTVKDNDGDTSNTAKVTIEVTDNISEEDISLIGIPRSMVSAICLDSNSNKSCEATEELEYRYDFGGASIYQSPRNPPTGEEILVVISDPAKINFFEESIMSFPNDTKELSMKSFIEWEYTPIDNKIYNTPEENLELFLAHQQNLNLLGQNGLSAEEASEASLEKIRSSIVELPDVEQGIIDPATPELYLHCVMNPKEAYEFAEEKRGEEKALVNDQLVKDFQCETGQLRTVQRYGFEDVFDLSNGVENASPSAAILANAELAAYNANVNSGFVNYDDVNNNRMFAESIENISSSITAGRIFIGFKSNGSSLQFNDAVYLGGYTTAGLHHYGDHLQDLDTANTNATAPWGHQLVGSTNPTTDVYWNDFSALAFSNPNNGYTTLLDYAQSNNQFDVLAQDDTSIDFITVATCSDKEPIAEITPILEKFQCKAAAGPDNETKVTITGGTLDAFASGVDAVATPSSALVNAVNPIVDYDSSQGNSHFIETLTLPATGYISRARLSVGVKPLYSRSGALFFDDRIHLGYLDVPNRATYDLYSNSSSSSSIAGSSEWTITSISNGEHVIQSDFGATSGANSLAWLRTQSVFDMLIQEDTSVDFTQLDLCIRDRPPFLDTDEDGFSDEEEEAAGSDPTNPSSTPDDIDGDGVPNNEDCDPFDPDLNTDCESKLPASCDTAVTVDLRQAASWLNASGVAPTENNVFTNTPHVAVWDPALNWFDFGSASNTEHELKIDFCSCGGGDVTVAEMKSDNYSSVKLDNGTAIVERTAYSQSTMATWGPSVSGTESFPYSGNGVNHSLVFKVKNVGGPSGGGIDGTLGFTGHLGKCNEQDVLPSSEEEAPEACRATEADPYACLSVNKTIVSGSCLLGTCVYDVSITNSSDLPFTDSLHISDSYTPMTSSAVTITPVGSAPSLCSTPSTITSIPFSCLQNTDLPSLTTWEYQMSTIAPAGADENCITVHNKTACATLP